MKSGSVGRSEVKVSKGRIVQYVGGSLGSDEKGKEEEEYERGPPSPTFPRTITCHPSPGLVTSRIKWATSSTSLSNLRAVGLNPPRS